jgi:hypothetical protein
MPVYGFDSSQFTVLQRGNMHTFTRFLGASRVSLHPLQRAGLVSADSHAMAPNMSASLHRYSLGDGPPAGHANLQMPPVVPIAGSPRDPSYQV